jgi:hypothetical protein
MTLDNILQNIHAIEETLLTYERKYGVLSETFYQAYLNGEEPDDDAWVLDWADWAGSYEIYLRRREQYRAALESLKQQAPLAGDIIKRTARRESIAIPAGV